MLQITKALPAATPIGLPDMMAQACVTTTDVASLHRHLFADASLDRTEATALFDLERAALSRCDAWTVFFIEALTEHVVWGERPTGRLDEAGARWLMSEVDSTRTPASFALLVNVLDEAASVPAWFPSAVRARAAAGWPGLPRGEDLCSRAVPAAAA